MAKSFHAPLILLGSCLSLVVPACGGVRSATSPPGDDLPDLPDAARPPVRAPDAASAGPLDAPPLAAPDASSPATKDAGPIVTMDAPGATSGDADPSGLAGAQQPPKPEAIQKPSTIVPVVWLQTDDDLRYFTPDKLPDSKAPGLIRIIENHDGTHADPFGFAKAPATFETRMSISLHGSSSRGFAQKSFSMNLLDSSGGGQKKAPLLGMPAGSDFDLIGCWTDKPCMRDPLAYWIGRGMGNWQPRSVFVEVYYNRQYLGLYQFTESPHADKTRVPLSKPAATDAAGDITGGYIFRREAGGKGGTRDFESTVSTPRGAGYPGVAPDLFAGWKGVFTYELPNDTDITPAQKTYLIDYIGKFETAMAADNWAQSYRNWIDVTTWADFWIMNELSNNVDAYFKSMYISKDRDPKPGTLGKLFQTPFWDFNIAFGNANYRDGWKIDTWDWQMNRFGGECTSLPERALPTSCNGTCAIGTTCFNVPYIPFWWERIAADPAFQKDARCRWDLLRKSVIDPDLIDSQIDAWAAALSANAVGRYFKKWPELKGPINSNPCGDMYKQPAYPALLFPNCGNTASSSTDYFNYEAKSLKSWVRNRIAWLDKNMPGTCQ